MSCAVDCGIMVAGPFQTHTQAMHWAEINGIDDWRLITLVDPVVAAGKMQAVRQLNRETRRPSDG